MPQPFLRHAPRSISNLFITSGRAKLRRLPPTNSSIWTPICTRCHLRAQRRFFADDNKPNDSPEAPTSSPAREPSHANNVYNPASATPSTSELPSAEEDRRSAISKRFSHLMDNLQGNIFVTSQRINDLTGYSGIEQLKKSIVQMEKDLERAQEDVHSARNTYKQTVADRASSQREVTSLLARKDTWTPSDLERFTTLYRSDHGNEQAVQEAATKLAEAERVAEHTASNLSTSILSRYHEEQIWSDKIRRMSTWGTWGLMGVNILLFLVFQLGFEPWRRKRLTKGFEEKVRQALEKEKQGGEGPPNGKKEEAEEAGLDGVVVTGAQELEMEIGDDKGHDGEPVVDAVATVIRKDTDEGGALWKQPETWKTSFLELFSDKVILLRKQDVTIIALEGAAAGAAVAGLLVRYLLSSK